MKRRLDANDRRQRLAAGLVEAVQRADEIVGAVPAPLGVTAAGAAARKPCSPNHERTGVSSPRITPAIVGWIPARRNPIHTTTPGTAYATARRTPSRCMSTTPRLPAAAMARPESVTPDE